MHFYFLNSICTEEIHRVVIINLRNNFSNYRHTKHTPPTQKLTRINYRRTQSTAYYTVIPGLGNKAFIWNALGVLFQISAVVVYHVVCVYPFDALLDKEI